MSTATGPTQALTIAERIEKGREAGNHYDGAIVPFPPGLKEHAILSALRGGERATVDRLRMGGYRPTYYEYRSTAGDVIQVVLRFDHPNAPKEIRPVRYCGRFDSGDVLWMKALDGPLPLYGLDRLAARPDAPVLVVEGEKAAEAAGRQFPDHVVITWQGGANNVHRLEMLELGGRTITLWPDNDPPGRAAMRKFAAHAYEAGAASVRIVDVPGEFGEKWDLADELSAELADQYPPQTLVETARLINPSEVAHLTSGAQHQAEQRRVLGYQPGYTRVPIEQIETALGLLDPAMFAHEWRRVARCLFYALGDEGLSLFDEWSKGCPDKYNEGEPARLWDRYRTEPGFRAASLAWLFRKAAKVLRDRADADDGGRPNVELDAEAVFIAHIEELNEDHAVVVRASKTGVLWENYDPRFKRYQETYLSKRDFVDKVEGSVALPADHDQQNAKKNKRMARGAAWFASSRRRSYDGVFFAPGEHLGHRYLNTWTGFAAEPTDNPEGWSLLKAHLRDNVAQGDQLSFNYILNWMAFAVQHLDRPIGSALILIGPKGAGKSIVTESFGHLFGRHKFVTPRMDDVTGRFNERLESTILLGLEEAVVPENRSADGSLKDLVTRSTLRLEGKFFGVWDAPNHLRIIATSNHEHVVRADGSERRYAVFDVANPHQSDPNARRSYFGKLVEQLETGGYSAMLGELLERDISGWNPECIPETEALRRQKLHNLANDPVRSYLHARLTDGLQITNGDSAGSVPIHNWSETETVFVPARDLNADFRIYCENNGLRFSERKLSMELPRYMPEGFKAETKRAKEGDTLTGTYKAYPFPSLEEARALFEAQTGFKIERET